MGLYDYEISAELHREINSIPGSEIRAYAKAAAETVMIRTYRTSDGSPAAPYCGSSYDERRPATPEEAAIIENLIVMGIKAARYETTNGHWLPDNIRSGASTAEWGGHVFFENAPEEINFYDTIFCPVIQFFRDRGAYRF